MNDTLMMRKDGNTWKLPALLVGTWKNPWIFKTFYFYSKAIARIERTVVSGTVDLVQKLFTLPGNEIRGV